MGEGQSGAKMNVSAQGLKVHEIKVSTVVFMIFCLCSAGAYGIEEMIPESGPGLSLVMLIVLPFVWGTPLGLVASELGSARPQEGGYYKWVQEAFGEFWGFQAGWWRTISIYIDNTLYVILAGGYLAQEYNLGWGGEFACKAAIIFFFTYINIRGVKDVGIVSTILSLLVIVAFAMVAICGFLNWQQNPFIPFTADGEIMGVSGIAFGDWIYYIGMGIAVGLWMYAGYESMSTVSGRSRKPAGNSKSDDDRDSADRLCLCVSDHGRSGFSRAVGELGNGRRCCRLFGCSNDLLGPWLWPVLPVCGGIGTVFDLQYIYRIGLKRLLRARGRQSGTPDPCPVRQEARSTLCRSRFGCGDKSDPLHGCL